MAESHEERELAAHEGADKEHMEHVHERLERLEKHLKLPKYNHKAESRSAAEKRDEAQRKRRHG